MKPIYQLGWPRALAKKIIPPLAHVMAGKSQQDLIRYLEAGLAAIQGKGSGSGWDLKSEIKGAISCIRRENPVVLDVGANVGDWSALLLARLPGVSRLILIEPQTSCLLHLNQLPCAHKVIVQSAVGEKIETRTMYIAREDSTVSSLYAGQATTFSDVAFDEEAVVVTTIDTVIQENELDVVDFLKMDIEGHELLALKGANESLAKGVIRALSFEFGASNINSRTYFRDFWELLTDHGYCIRRIAPGGVTIQVQEYYEDLEYFRGASNYIAFLD